MKILQIEPALNKLDEDDCFIHVEYREWRLLFKKRVKIYMGSGTGWFDLDTKRSVSAHTALWLLDVWQFYRRGM